MGCCLVTGGAGFIGSHLATALVAAGEGVRILDDLSTGKRKNLEPIADRVEFIEGDVVDASAVDEAMEGVDVVFHLAAMVSVPQSVAEPWRCHEICAGGTLRVLNAAKQAGARRVVYAASSSAYGDTGAGPIAENRPLQPMSPYAAAKLAGEHYCSALAATSNLETVRLRFFNVFGPNQEPSSPYSGVISIFTTSVLAGRNPTIFGDGLQTRDFIFVSDVVDALLKAAGTPNVSGQVFNVGRGEAATLLELLEAVNSAAGTKATPMLAPARLGDIRHSQANVDSARQRLGFAPAVSLRDGLKECIRFYGG